MGRAMLFRGINVEVVASRVRARTPDKHYYEIRAPDERWASPAMLEEKVNVGLWGTLISPQPLDFHGEAEIELTDSEARELLGGDDEGGARTGS